MFKHYNIDPGIPYGPIVFFSFIQFSGKSDQNRLTSPPLWEIPILTGEHFFPLNEKEKPTLHISYKVYWGNGKSQKYDSDQQTSLHRRIQGSARAVCSPPGPIYYRPQTKLREGKVFTTMHLGREGVSLHAPGQGCVDRGMWIGGVDRWYTLQVAQCTSPETAIETGG